MCDLNINSLKDLNRYSSAPMINDAQREILLNELKIYIKNSDWLTIGIMASSSKVGISSLKELERFFDWSEMTIKNIPTQDGPVFLKANQKNGEAYVRLENGLGEGILLSCQSNNQSINAYTFGPFPLNFFKSRND